MKFQCKCGYVMVFQTDYLPYDLQLIQSNVIGDEFDKALTEVMRIDSVNSDAIDDITDKHDSAINMSSLSVMHCPNCGRYHVEDGFRSGKFVSYLRESS